MWCVELEYKMEKYAEDLIRNPKMALGTLSLQSTLLLH
jgi:hypothetical protein